MATTDHGSVPPSPTQPIEPDKSLNELLAGLTSDFSNLVSTHVELAKVEIKEEVAKAGKGAGLIGGGAIAGLMALILLSFAAAWGLAEIVDAGWAFLIVGLVWTAVAAYLAKTGRDRLNEAHGPEKTIEEVKEDAQWMRQQAS